MNFKNTKLMLLTAVFSVFSYVVQAQYLSARDIYKYAKSRNYNALSRISGYIDTQDGSGNTALCLAAIDNDYQTYNLLRRYGANPQPYCIQSAMAASGSSTFLGMGVTGWLVTGVIVAGGVGIAAGGGGGGGSADSSSSNDSSPSITCINGSISNGQCQCNDGWTGDTCNTAKTCSYNTTSCASGYEETGNTCKSGNIIYKECRAKTVPDGYTKNPCGNGYTQVDTFLSGADTYYKCEVNACPMDSTTSTSCPSGYLAVHTGEYSGNQGCFRCVANECSGYQSSCENGYHATTDTCLSGSKTMYKCEINDCSAYQTSCGEGYNATQSCLSGTTPYYTCTPKRVPAGYTSTPCGNGYTQVDTFLSGTQTYYKCKVNACTGYVTSCGNGYHTTSDTCQSGTTTMYKCEANNCAAGSTSPTCSNGQHLIPTGEYSGNQQCFICVDDDTPLNCGAHGMANGDVCQCDSGWDGTLCNLPDENHIIGTDGNLYEKLTCENGGTQVNASCSCPDGWEGNLCQNAKTCSGYVTSCDNGYHTTSDTCQSGNNTMYKCEADICEGYQTSCGDGYHATTDTCLSGTETKVKCAVNDCSAYQTSCSDGYNATQSCLSGTTPYYTCTPKDVPAGYTATPCDEGYTTKDTIVSGETPYYLCEVNSCDGYNLSFVPSHCADYGFCKKGNIPVYKCNTCQDGWSGSDCSVYNDTGDITDTDTGSEIIKKNITNDDVTHITDGFSSYYVGINNENIAAIVDSANSVIGINVSNSITNNTNVEAIINAIDNADEKVDIEIVQRGKGDVYGMRFIDQSNGNTQNHDISLCNVFGYNNADGTIKIVDTSGNSDTENKDDFGHIYGMYSEVENVTNAALEGSTLSSIVRGTIDITSNADKHIYGLVAYSDTTNSEGDYDGLVVGHINIINSGNGDVYGIESTGKIHNTDASDESVVEGYITIENSGDGNIFGISADTDTSNKIYSARASDEATAKSEIRISNTGSGDVYGINYSGSSNDSETCLYNAFAKDDSTATGKIVISNFGNGSVYGMKSTRNVFNTYNRLNGKAVANGIINITNAGTGNSYGIYADWIKSLYEDQSSNYHIANSTVNVINTGSGNAYGMYGRDVQHITTGSKMTSTIELANIGDGLVVGIYSKNGTIENSGNIKIHNLADGVVVGIYADGSTNATNSGNIIIDRETFVDDRASDDTSDDITYTAKSIKGGKAIGIYGATGSHITNTASGVIRIDNAEKAYGIWSDGGYVTNNGTIVINGDINHKNAIKLNGGQLFQDGVLKVDGNWCGLGYGGEECDVFDSEHYIEQDGHVYTKLHCIYGTQQADSCICEIGASGDLCENIADGYIEQDGHLYTELNCVHGLQQANSCVCDLGYTGNLCDSLADGYAIADDKLARIIGRTEGNDTYHENSENIGIIGIISDSNGTADSNGNINLINRSDGSVYGMYSGDYANNANEGQGVIKIDNVGNGNIYGMYGSGYGKNAINSQGLIKIDNLGNGDVYGMKCGYGFCYNSSDGSGIISIDNTGDGNVYGMFGGYNTVNVIGSYGSKGLIRISNNGGGNAYGLHGDRVENVTNADVGVINIINKGSGVAFGLHSSMYAKNSSQSMIEMANVNNGLAVGIYGYGTSDDYDNYNNTIYNYSSDIIIHNLGNGAAIGMYADNYIQAINRGNITIDRESYTDDMATEDTSDDETYYKTSDVGGIAIGIYGVENSSILNDTSGIITIKDAGKAYGIWSEGGTVTNNGKIYIDNVLRTDRCDSSDCITNNNAIVLNGGKLFQNGKMIVGAYVSDSGCEDGFVEQKGVCYPYKDCQHGIQDAHVCKCNTGYDGDLCENVADGYIEQDGNIYPKLECINGSQHANSCDCNLGYTGEFCNTFDSQNYIQQDGQVYVRLYCNHGTQQANSCVCQEGYAGDLCSEPAIISNDNTYVVSKDFDSYNVSFNNTEERNIVGLYLSNELEVGRYSNGTSESVGSINLSNHSDGDVYGIFSNVGYGANADGNDGTICIHNEGNGDVYGMYDRYGKGVTNGRGAKGIISIDTTGDGDVYGLYGGYQTENSTGYEDVADGLIRINNNGTGTTYGIYGYSGNIGSGYGGRSVINILNHQSGNAYGMYNEKSITKNESCFNCDYSSYSTIEMANVGDGLAVGMYTHGGENGNSGTITIHNLGDGKAFGIYAENDASNTGHIIINRETFVDNMATDTTSDDITYTSTSTSGGIAVGMKGQSLYNDKIITINGANTAIGMYGLKDSYVTNVGTITINGGEMAIGIYGENNSEIINDENGVILINGANTGYGIYAEKDANVTNDGTITINGVSCTGINCIEGDYNNAIVLNGGNLFQDGVVTVSSAMPPQSVEPMSVSSVKPASLNLNDFGGTVIASNTSQFIVEGAISGDLAINNNVIENGFDTAYSVKDMIQASDTSGLNLQSQSALFDATLENDTDVVMIMKAFNDVVENSSVADFLQNNYTANNNEYLFKTLKSAASVAELNNNIDDLFGKNILSRMAFEDLSMLREVSLDMNNHLFKQEGAFAFGENISPSSYDNNIGSVGRYSLNGYNNGKMSFGIGVSITDVRTDDGNNDNRRFDRNFMMSAPIGYKTHGFELITAPKMGYADGTYDRDGFNNMTYKGKIQKRVFALMNEARYPLKFGGMKLVPSAEFNMIGYNIKGHEDDKQYALRIKSQNHYSVEAGFGLMAEKKFKPHKNHKFNLNGGVAVYHEFDNPYELDVAMNSMSGTYCLQDEKRSDNRAVVRFGFGYEFKDNVDVSASWMTNIDREYRTDANIDLKYHF